MKIFQIILAVLVIFGAGVITGGLTVRLATPRKKSPAGTLPARWWSQQRSAFLARMDRQLRLSPEQHQNIDRIVSQGQEEMRKIWQTVAPRAQEEARHTRQQILNELNPQQRRKFNELFKFGRPRGPAELRAPRPPRKKNVPALPPLSNAVPSEPHS